MVHQIRVFAAALLRALHQHQARASDPSRLEVRAEQHIREKSAAIVKSQQPRMHSISNTGTLQVTFINDAD